MYISNEIVILYILRKFIEMYFQQKAIHFVPHFGIKRKKKNRKVH